jgi:succinyl-diaminopimelate desuccinylase
MNSLTLARKLIQYRTVSPVESEDGFKPLKDLFETHGIDYEIIEIDGVNNLIAQKGSGKPHICFNGHLDVVPAEENSWEITSPYKPLEKNGKLYGRGSADMKGGLASMATAFANLEDFSGKITFMAVGDEEIEGSVGTKKLIEGEDIDYAVVGEPTSMDVKIGVRGLLQLGFMIKGNAGHASRPHLADNPMKSTAKAIKVLEEVELHSDIEEFPDPTFEVTQLETDNPRNVIPGQVKIGVDSRYTSNYDPEELIQKVKNLLKDEEIDFEVTESRYKKPALTENNILKEIAMNAVEKHYSESVFTCEGGTSDGVFFDNAGIPFIQLGPKKTSHMSDEHINIEELDQLDQIYQEMAQELLK